MLNEKTYVASRHQGNIVGEFIIGFTAWVGGPIASNTVIFLFSLAGVILLRALLLSTGASRAASAFAVAVLLTNSWYLIVSSTSIETVIAITLFMGGLYAIHRGQDVAAIVLFAAATGTRITYLPLALITVNYLLYRRTDVAGGWRWGGGILYAASLILCAGTYYLPVWIAHGLGFEWLSAALPYGQGLLGVIARFTYKTIYLFGLAGSVLALYGLFLERKKYFSTRLEGAKRDIFVIGTVMAVYHLIIFLTIPAKPSYLLPALVGATLMLALLDLKKTLCLLSVGQLIGGYLSLELLDVTYESQNPCLPAVALSASFSPHFAPGPLIKDLNGLRFTCYDHVIRAFPGR